MAVLALLAGTPCFASVRHPRRSARAYARALKLQRKLEAKPPRQRTLAEYERTINEFRAVYWFDFASLKAPISAETMGDLYTQMGQIFSDSHYFHDAIKAYNYVITQYPQSTMAIDSSLSIGNVYLEDLHEPDHAQEVFRAFLEKHASLPLAEVARKRLQEIAARQTEQASPRTQTVSAQQPVTGRSVEITQVHQWAGPNYTRVVISAGGPFKYDTIRLEHPDRIVFDLANTYLPRSLLGKTIQIDGDFLQDIRVGQYEPNITRIVLDVNKFEDYSAFSISNPYRLIIDIRGASTTTAGKPTYREASALVTTPAPSRSIPVPARTNTAVVKRHSLSSSDPEIEAANRIRQHKHQETEIASIRRKPDAIPISIKPASPIANGSETLMRALGLKVTRIVIDPGHGGFDTGAIGPDGLEEKNVALDIGLRLRRLFQTRTDDQVFMTRSTDKFIPLEERTAIANADHADLFISIHANASPDHHVRGIATYFLNFTTDPRALKVAARENATSQDSVYQLKSLIKKIALNNKIQESQQLARDIQSVLWRRMSRISRGIQNRGVQKAPFVVLIGANMPSVLVETGFITNPRTEHLLSEPAYREQIAKGIFNGVEDYINNLGSVRVAQRTR